MLDIQEIVNQMNRDAHPSRVERILLRTGCVLLAVGVTLLIVGLYLMAAGN